MENFWEKSSEGKANIPFSPPTTAAAAAKLPPTMASGAIRLASGTIRLASGEIKWQNRKIHQYLRKIAFRKLVSISKTLQNQLVRVHFRNGKKYEFLLHFWHSLVSALGRRSREFGLDKKIVTENSNENILRLLAARSTYILFRKRCHSDGILQRKRGKEKKI